MTLYTLSDSLTQFLLLPMNQYADDTAYVQTAPNTLTRMNKDGTFRESQIITDDQGRPLTKTEFYKDGTRHLYEDLQNPEGIAKQTAYFANGRKYCEFSHDLKTGQKYGPYTEYYNLENSPVKVTSPTNKRECGRLLGAYTQYGTQGRVIETGTINQFGKHEGEFKKWDEATGALLMECTYDENGTPNGYYMEVLQNGLTVEGVRLGRKHDIRQDTWARKTVKDKDGNVREITRFADNVNVSFTTSVGGWGLLPNSLRIKHAENGMGSSYVFDDDGKLGKFDTYNTIRNTQKERHWDKDGTSDIVLHNGLRSSAIKMRFDKNKKCTKEYNLSTLLSGYSDDVPSPLYYLFNMNQLWNRSRTEKADMNRPTFNEIIANHGLESFIEPIASELATPVLK